LLRLPKRITLPNDNGVLLVLYPGFELFVLFVIVLTQVIELVAGLQEGFGEFLLVDQDADF
jgi:hypothetical protein